MSSPFEMTVAPCLADRTLLILEGHPVAPSGGSADCAVRSSCRLWAILCLSAKPVGRKGVPPIVEGGGLRGGARSPPRTRSGGETNRPIEAGAWSFFSFDFGLTPKIGAHSPELSFSSPPPKSPHIPRGRAAFSIPRLGGGQALCITLRSHARFLPGTSFCAQSLGAIN
jgi:hypothetical protein